MQRSALALVGLSSALVGAISLAMSGDRLSKQHSSAVETTITVAAVRVKSLAIQEVTDVVAHVRSVQDVSVSAEVRGKIVEIGFEDGQFVQEGHVLFRLDDGDASERLELAKAELEQARTLVQLRQRAKDRSERLAQLSHVSAEQLEIRRAELDAAAAEAKVAEVSVRVAVRELNRFAIRAPFAGYVGARTVSLGSMVEPGSPKALVQLRDMNTRLDFGVPQWLVSGAVVDIRVLSSKLRSPISVTCPGVFGPRII